MRLSAEAKVGATLVISLVLLASMAMALGRVDFRQPTGFELQVSYSRVDGLREGAPVRFAGVKVGEVSFVRLESPGVVVGVRIDRDLLIPSDSQFVIANVGVLGDKHVEIYPGGAQEVLTENSRITGKDPVQIDSILGEVETALRGLNNVVNNFAEITNSPELQDSIVQSGVVMQETVLGLKQAVDQIGHLTESAQNITDQLEGFATDLNQAEVGVILENAKQFSETLNELELAESLEQLSGFGEKLSELPIDEISHDLQTFSKGLVAFDLSGMEQEVRQFTKMLANFDISPLMLEINSITEDLAELDLSARGEELASFTKQLSEFPLEDLGADLKKITQALTEVPVVEIGDSLLTITNQIEDLPLAAVVGDLQVLTKQMTELGLEEMAGEVRQFTKQLANLEIERSVEEITADIQGLTDQFDQVDLVYLFSELNETVEGLNQLVKGVEPSRVEGILANLETSAANVNDASAMLGDVFTNISGETSAVLNDTSLVLVKLQGAVDQIGFLVSDVQQFVDDVIDDGETATMVRGTLESIQTSTDSLGETLDLVKTELPLTQETFEGLQNTMLSIQKINEDIQTFKGMGEKVDIESNWGLSYLVPEGGEAPRLSADILFEFEPEEYPAFFVVGWSDLGESNRFQLQYGKESGSIRQRYGIIDTTLGVGIDGKVNDKWVLSADLRDIAAPKLRLRADYQWIPDWWLTLRANDVFRDNSGGFSLGVERDF